jgi:hypothetical protein
MGVLPLALRLAAQTRYAKALASGQLMGSFSGSHVRENVTTKPLVGLLVG